MSSMDDLIERLAREAGMDPPGDIFLRWGADDAALRRFAALVAEKCAKECERTKNHGAARFMHWFDCAAAIRAKFKEPSNE